MVPGHTKFKCDGNFGMIKKLYRKTRVDCLDNVVSVVKKSSPAGLNKAQCYEGGKGFQYLDIKAILGIYFKKLPSTVKPRFNESMVLTQKFVETRKFVVAINMIDILL